MSIQGLRAQFRCFWSARNGSLKFSVFWTSRHVCWITQATAGIPVQARCERSYVNHLIRKNGVTGSSFILGIETIRQFLLLLFVLHEEPGLSAAAASHLRSQPCVARASFVSFESPFSFCKIHFAPPPIDPRVQSNSYPLTELRKFPPRSIRISPEQPSHCHSTFPSMKSSQFLKYQTRSIRIKV